MRHFLIPKHRQKTESESNIPQIRAAMARDSEEIHELSLHLGYEIESQAATEQNLDHLLNTNFNYVWVFEKDHQIQGWIHLFIAHRITCAPFVEIGGLVVAPHCRRQGIGRSLVEHAKQWAQQNHMHLRVRCNTKRLDTHLFYESMGFSTIKSQYVFEA